ncbi:putative Glycoside hydrolase family 43 protein [Seiridium unicorne]|uniref:Glycoside hydrolase family 43 protein n=1 Tax=Seiridium unicorne TaxID=138068 RepID=A0ABR2ULK0_9PEZI
MKRFGLAFAGSVLVTIVTCMPTVSTTDKHALGKRDDFSYVFSTFRASDQQTDHEVTKLDIYVSTSGVDFSEYAMDTYKPASGLVRDPSILKIASTYYVAHTTDWNGNTLGVIKSTKLKDWSAVTTITLDDDVKKAWAPEFFYDTDGSVYIFVSLKTSDDPFHAYILSSQSDDMSKWSTAEKLNVDDNDKGSSQPHIDMFPLYVSSDSEYPYHAFQKNEDEKHIEQLHSKSLKGPWEYMDGFTNDWAGWGKEEGPAVTTLPDGKYILWMDNMKGNFAYTTTSDLNNKDSYSDKTSMPVHQATFRHGTVIRI